MGTNYYLRKKPLLEQREELKKLIDSSSDGSNFREILEMANEMYGECDRYERDKGIVHLGKSSAGWKFLWNPNIVEKNFGHYDMEKKEFIDDFRTVKKYDLSREGIINFVMDDSYVLYNEYGEVQDKEQFLDWALNKDGLDSITYHEKYPDEPISFHDEERQNFWKRVTGCLFFTPWQSDFEIDGLRFSTSVEFC